MQVRRDRPSHGNPLISPQASCIIGCRPTEDPARTRDARALLASRLGMEKSTRWLEHVTAAASSRAPVEGFWLRAPPKPAGEAPGWFLMRSVAKLTEASSLSGFWPWPPPAMACGGH
jgi:hypothetical protein